MAEEMTRKTYEWEVTFVVEGWFPQVLPKSINKDCVLSCIKTPKGETINMLTLTIHREYAPSKTEITEVQKFALEEAERIASLYSLSIRPMKVLRLKSLDQVTAFQGERYHSETLTITVPRLAIPELTWSEKVKSLQDIIGQSFREYLLLALTNFGLAMWVFETKLKFLHLMMCMEGLFNDGPQELRYRISHRLANLLGKTEERRQEIFSDFSALYDKRNKLVHSLKPIEVSGKDQDLLISYSKCSLIAFLKLRKKKDAALKEIDKAVYDTQTRNDLQKICEDAIEALEIDRSRILGLEKK